MPRKPRPFLEDAIEYVMSAPLAEVLQLKAVTDVLIRQRQATKPVPGGRPKPVKATPPAPPAAPVAPAAPRATAPASSSRRRTRRRGHAAPPAEPVGAPENASEPDAAAEEQYGSDDQTHVTE